MPQICVPGQSLGMTHFFAASSGSWQTFPRISPVSASVERTQRRLTGQSREVVHWEWQRLKAQTSGLLQSVLMVHDLMSSPGGGLSPPPQAPRAIATTANTQKQPRTERIAFKAPSKAARVQTPPN